MVEQVSDSVIRAFGAEHVMALTGLSKAQLRYWDTVGFFQPAMAYEHRRSPYSRIYSFKDVVGLRTLAVLRHDHKISLKRLRDTAGELSQYSKTPWADLILYVFNKEVYFDEPETGKVRSVLSKQYTTLPLISVIEDIRNKSLKLRDRSQDQVGNVERHRYVAHNAWVIAGTRVPVAAIRRFHEAGYTPAQIVKEYPNITEQDVAAALAYTQKLTA